MKKKNRKHFLLLLLFLVSIGFASITSRLFMTGEGRLAGGNFNVYLDNFVVDENYITVSNYNLDANTGLYIDDLAFEDPGDKLKFTVDIVNDGNVGALLDSFDLSYYDNNGRSTLPSYFSYSVKYADGTDVSSSKRTIPVSGSITLYVEVNYINDFETPLTVEKINYEFEFDASIIAVERGLGSNKYICTNNMSPYISNDEYNRPVCIRAKSLNSEVCSNESAGCSQNGYDIGDDIIYGNCGTEYNHNFGDAFICDVNDDLIYDEETERFYYIEESNEYSYLLYYTNAVNGEKSSATFKYVRDGQSDVNLVYLLPTIDKWKVFKRLMDDDSYRFQKSQYVGSMLDYGILLSLVVDPTTEGSLSNNPFLFQDTKFSNSNNKNEGYYLYNFEEGYLNVENACVSNRDYEDKYGLRPVIFIPSNKLIN